MPRPPAANTAASAHLNFIRGLAALFVAFGHARILVMREPHEFPHMAIWQKLLYFAASLGEGAVMVFFALSGFLVGSSVIRAVAAKRWDWRSYAAARISRIHTVLVPAVLIGAAIDLLGAHYLPHAQIYAGSNIDTMVEGRIVDAISPPIILGNIACLQRIWVPMVGSNTPLWSLANEWWYYVLFPALCCTIVGRRTPGRLLGNGLCALLVVAIMPWLMRLLFPIWLLGALVTFLPKLKFNVLWLGACVGGLVGFIASGLVIHAPMWRGVVPYGEGLFAALMIYLICCLEDCRPSKIYAAVAGYLSSISFTLYVAHLPFLVLLTALLIRKPTRSEPTLTSFGIAFAFTLIAILYATVLWFLFERQTPIVRRGLDRLFGVQDFSRVKSADAPSAAS